MEKETVVVEKALLEEILSIVKSNQEKLDEIKYVVNCLDSDSTAITEKLGIH